MGVEQHGRRAGRGGPVGEDGGRAAVGRDDRDVGRPGPPGQLGDGLGAAAGVVRVRGVGPDAGDADEAFEVGARPGQLPLDGGAQVGLGRGVGPARGLVGHGGRLYAGRRGAASTPRGAVRDALAAKSRSRRVGNADSPSSERRLGLAGRAGTVGCGHVPVPGDVAGVRIPVGARHGHRRAARARAAHLARGPRARAGDGRGPARRARRPPRARARLGRGGARGRAGRDRPARPGRLALRRQRDDAAPAHGPHRPRAPGPRTPSPSSR